MRSFYWLQSSCDSFGRIVRGWYSGALKLFTAYTVNRIERRFVLLENGQLGLYSVQESYLQTVGAILVNKNYKASD